MPRLTDSTGTIVAGPGLGEKFDPMAFMTTTEQDFQRSNYLIYGPKKTGKSLLAATISRYFPPYENGNPVAAKERTTLEDTAWIAFDKSPTDTLVQYRCFVGKVLDLRMAFRKLGRDEFFFRLPLLLSPIIQDEKIKYVVVDTVSEFNRLLLNWWYKHVPTSDRGKENTMAMWTKFGDDHSELRYVLNDQMEIGGRRDRKLIYLSHPKGNMEFVGGSGTAEVQKVNEERKAEATGKGDIDLDITGQNGNGYGAECSMILVTQRMSAARNDRARYEVWTQGNESWAGGTRFSTVLKPTEIPNLRTMEEKILKAAGE